MNKTLFRRYVFLLCAVVLFSTASRATSTSDAGSDGVLEVGSVYRFQNVGYPSLYLTATSECAYGLAETGTDTQMWYVADTDTDSSGYTRYKLRSYSHGTYLQGNTSSSQWNLTDGTSDSNYLYLFKVGDYYTFSLHDIDKLSTNSHSKMHCASSQSYKIVGWEVSSTPTQWIISEVEDITEDEITANFAELEEINTYTSKLSGWQTALDAIFSDNACTTLNSTYSSMSETVLEADDNYLALPTTLQNMVKKIWNVANGTDVSTAWAEDNYDSTKPSWDGEYAKRYRIQLYEAYTDRDCVPNALKINQHTNFNNPTGIFANTRDMLFIMVDDDVPDGATLYFHSQTGNSQGGDATSGVALTKGLNVIPYFDDLNWSVIYYSVKTMQAWDDTNSTNFTEYKLSDFPDLKIHIEGGNVNGYYNAVGDKLYAHGRSGDNVYENGDSAEDWDYLAARNNLTDLTILGKYMVFQFYFNETVDSGGKTNNGMDYYLTADEDGKRRTDIPAFIEMWDRIALSERLLQGVTSKDDLDDANDKYQAPGELTHDIFAYTGNDEDLGCDYSDRYRQHYMAIGMTSGYMSGGGTSSNYHVNTFSSIVEQIATSQGASWGPGHEIGHQNQGPINMNGLTEVTNNLYANVAVWYAGIETSRNNGGQGNLSSVAEVFNTAGTDFFDNNIWAQTHMYYKLWLYYHLCGNNNKFYPRLFEYLRRDPLHIQYTQADANGEVSGYTPLLHFYKAACYAAGEDLTEFFTAYGFFEPMEARFVDDYNDSKYTQTEEQIQAAQETVKDWGYPENTVVLFINDANAETKYYSHDGTTALKQYGDNVSQDMGSYTVFVDKTEVSGTPSISISDESVTVSGITGAIGIAIRDADGNLIGFSSDYTFSLSEEALAALADGTATISAVSSTGKTTNIEYGETAAAHALLQTKVDEVESEIAKVDNGGDSGEDYTMVGFYKHTAVEEINEILEKANTVLDLSLNELYVSVYEELTEAFTALLEDEYAKVSYIEGHTKFALVNNDYPTRYMVDSNGTIATVTVNEGDDIPENAVWELEQVSGMTVYMHNIGNDTYISSISDLSKSVSSVDSSSKIVYTITQIDDNKFAFYYTQNDNDYALHCDASYNIVGWYSSSSASQWHLKMIDIAEDDQARQDLQELVEKTSTLLNQVASISPAGAAIELSESNVTSNATESGHEVKYLFDGNTNNFFHTVWSSLVGTDPEEDHYLLIDLGEDDWIDEFQFSYATRYYDAGYDAPKTIVVEGSTDNSTFTEITTLTSDDEDNPIPAAGSSTYQSNTLGTSGTYYRYIRLRVTNATGETFNGYYYFGMSALGLTRVNTKINSINEEYASDIEYFDSGLTNTAATYDASVTLLADTDATATDLTERYNSLYTYYEDLLALTVEEEEEVVDENLQVSLQELKDTIDELNALLEKVGEPTYEQEAITLQSTDETANGYIYVNAPYTYSQNADYSTADNGYHLLDGDIETYLHTDYEGQYSDEYHYIRVYFPDGLGKFAFTYTTRHNGDAQPLTMVVEGCNEADGTYTKLVTLTSSDSNNPLPTKRSAVYNSDPIGSDNVTYKYIRFRVTKSAGQNSYGYYFCLAEFGMSKVLDNLIMNEETAGIITVNEYEGYTNTLHEAGLLYYNSEATTSTVEETIQTLKATIEEINEKMNLIADTSALSELIEKAQTLVNSCYDSEGEIISDYASGYSMNPVSEDLLSSVKSLISSATALVNQEEIDRDEYESAYTYNPQNEAFG